MQYAVLCEELALKDMLRASNLLYLQRIFKNVYSGLKNI